MARKMNVWFQSQLEKDFADNMPSVKSEKTWLEIFHTSTISRHIVISQFSLMEIGWSREGW